MDRELQDAIDEAKALRARSYAIRCTAQLVFARSFVLRRTAVALAERAKAALSELARPV